MTPAKSSANLTEQIRQGILRQILEGVYAPGQKIPPEREMSERTGTSRITVRRAYGLLEKDGIINRSDRSGTRVTEAYQGNHKSPDFIALLTTLRDPFARDFIEAVQDACNERDILTVLSVTPEDTEQQKKMAFRMVAKGIRNMIVWGFDRSLDMAAFERMRIIGVNQVFFDRIVPGDFADFVGIDNRHAMKRIVRQAIKDGMRHLAFVDSSGLDVDSNRQRREAAHRETEALGLPCPSLSLPWHSLDADEIAPICRRFFETFHHRRDTALICVNDIMALRVHPFVPKGMAMYSIDGSLAATDKGIVSYSQPIGKMAKAAVGALIDQQAAGREWQARKFLIKGRLQKPETVRA